MGPQIYTAARVGMFALVGLSLCFVGACCRSASAVDYAHRYSKLNSSFRCSSSSNSIDSSLSSYISDVIFLVLVVVVIVVVVLVVVVVAVAAVVVAAVVAVVAVVDVLPSITPLSKGVDLVSTTALF
jgi:hypothetical protein